MICLDVRGVVGLVSFQDGVVWTGPDAGFPRVDRLGDWRFGEGLSLARPRASDEGEEEDDPPKTGLAFLDGDTRLRRRFRWVGEPRGDFYVGYSRNSGVFSWGTKERTHHVAGPDREPGLPPAAAEALWFERLLRRFDPSGPGVRAVETVRWHSASKTLVHIEDDAPEEAQWREAVATLERTASDSLQLSWGPSFRRVHLGARTVKVFGGDPLARGATFDLLTLPACSFWLG